MVKPSSGVEPIAVNTRGNNHGPQTEGWAGLAQDSCFLPCVERSTREELKGRYSDKSTMAVANQAYAGAGGKSLEETGQMKTRHESEARLVVRIPDDVRVGELAWPVEGNDNCIRRERP